MTPKIRLALASILAVCALGAIAPAANADIYWGQDYIGIGRASLDGFDVDSSFVTGGTPGYVAVDSNSVYWTNLNADIGRASKDGTGSPAQSFIDVADGAYPSGIAIDSGTVFWANFLGNTIQTANASTGLGTQTLLSANTPVGVALDKNYIYWTNPGDTAIGRAKRDGSEFTLDFIAPLNSPTAIAVDSKYIYWTNNGNGTIGRAKLDGTDVRDNFITGAALPQGVAVDANYIYWGNFDRAYIGRAKLDGTGVDQQFIDLGGSFAVGVAVDPSPSLAPVGKATKRSLKVKVGCGDVSVCTLQLSGNKVGTKLALSSKTVTTDGSGFAVATLAYTPRLRKALAKGGRITIKATNPATDAYRSTVVRVAK